MFISKQYKRKRLITESGLFDPTYYQMRYASVLSVGQDPLQNFMKFGLENKHSPNSLFDPIWYESQHPEAVKESGSALEHYILSGYARKYSPHPLFDSAWYLERYQDVAATLTDPLRHYIEYGDDEGRNPNAYFQSSWYRENYCDAKASGMNSLAHYVEYGESLGYSPNPDFDVSWYNSQITDCDLRSFTHYMLKGRHKNLAVGPANVLSTITLEKSAIDATIQVPVVKGEARCIIIDATYPTPDRDSGSIDAVNFIRIFQRLGYKVYFIAVANFRQQNLDLVSLQAKLELEALGVKALDSRHGESPHEIVRLNGGYFRFYFLSRFNCGGEFYEHVRAHSPRSKIIFNTVDLHSLRELREAQVKKDRKAEFQSYQTAEREYYLSRLSDATVVVSSDEKEILNQQAPGGNVFYVPLIRDIPVRAHNYSQRADIVFIGSYDHLPNLDAALYFLDQIWPIVHAAIPDCRFLLAGSKMPESLSARKDTGLHVLGHISHVSEVFDSVRLSVAPLRYGAGAKGKVVTSLSFGVPCITTSIAAEGMGIGEARVVLVADDPQQFAECVIESYINEALWTKLSVSGYEMMKEQFSFEAGYDNTKKMIDFIEVEQDWPN